MKTTTTRVVDGIALVNKLGFRPTPGHRMSQGDGYWEVEALLQDRDAYLLRYDDGRKEPEAHPNPWGLKVGDIVPERLHKTFSLDPKGPKGNEKGAYFVTELDPKAHSMSFGWKPLTSAKLAEVRAAEAILRATEMLAREDGGGTHFYLRGSKTWGGATEKPIGWEEAPVIAKPLRDPAIDVERGTITFPVPAEAVEEAVIEPEVEELPPPANEHRARLREAIKRGMARGMKRRTKLKR